MANAIDLVRAQLAKVSVPRAGDRVYKDECAYSFDTPESPNGLYVCLSTFMGFGEDYVGLNFQKTGNALYLQIKTTRKPVEPEENKSDDNGPPKKKTPTKMAIGVEGGFDGDAPMFEYEHQYQLVVFPDRVAIPIDNPDLPSQVTLSINAIIAAESAAFEDKVQAWEETRLVSAYAESMVQIDNGVKIPPKGWQCANCGLQENLWLNLTDGTILCGRKQVGGAEGNGHALAYYQQTQFPVCVKLGTITPEGADVYSYAEDDFVIDPLLAKHLAHFGINMMQMEKTSATTMELEIKANENMQFEMDRMQESGKTLQPLYGPGYTGLKNLGNTCYMNSVLQVLFSLPEIQARYFANAQETLRQSPANPLNDQEAQLAKLALGLLSGKYSTSANPQSDENSISPRSFKALIGKGHPEFSTNKQQDALEFLQHLFTQLDRESHRNGRGAVSNNFKFVVEQKIMCSITGKVRYTQKEEAHLFLPVDLEQAKNRDAVLAYYAAWKAHDEQNKASGKKEPFRQEPVLAQLDLETLISNLFSAEMVDDWYSPAAQTKTTAIKSQSPATFPKYLVLAIDKFYMDTDWTTKKKGVALNVPSEFDLSAHRATGVQPGEELLPEDAPAAPAAPVVNEQMVQELASMGFHPVGCRKAVIKNPTSIEAAMEWVMQHMGDPDFETPEAAPAAASQGAGSSSSSEPTDDQLAMIESMGFTRSQARKALKATNNNVERAADWIFNHMDDLDAPDEPAAAPAAAAGAAAPLGAGLPNGSGKYRLKAFISHSGNSTTCGHYVCHILKDGQWAIFNDSKVAKSENPPTEMGYLYFYESI